MYWVALTIDEWPNGIFPQTTLENSGTFGWAGAWRLEDQLVFLFAQIQEYAFDSAARVAELKDWCSANFMLMLAGNGFPQQVPADAWSRYLTTLSWYKRAFDLSAR